MVHVNWNGRKLRFMLVLASFGCAESVRILCELFYSNYFLSLDDVNVVFE